VVGATDCGADGAGRGNSHVDGPHPDGFARLCKVSAARNTHYTANMSSGVSVDEFQALEQKVLRAVEIVKREREARAAAEAEVAALREQLAAQAKSAQSEVQAVESRAQAVQREKDAAENQIAALNQERDAVRQRVEKMLQQMDELL
jgi:hypothetical protein